MSRDRASSGRKTIAIRADLHKNLRAEAFIRNTTIAKLLDEIVDTHYGLVRGRPHPREDEGEENVEAGLDL